MHRAPRVHRRLDASLLAVAAIGLGLWVAVWIVILANPTLLARFYGVDFGLYTDATRRWLAGGDFYNAYQLAGPYVVSFGDILYPPPAIVLFAPFTIIPALIWWAIPAALVIFAIGRLRPVPWSLVAIVACLWWPETTFRILCGDPVMWVVALLAVGAIRPFFVPFAMVKPTLSPAAALNIRRRAWWFGLATFAAISVAFLPMWPSYLSALANVRADVPWAYSLREIPLVAIPWIAWLGRTRYR